MVVRTETPALAESRRFVLEMLLRRYADAGYAAGDRDETEFQHWVRHYGARLPEGVRPAARYAVNSDPNPFVWVDLNKCILCTRCVRACEEVQGRFVWGVGYRGRRREDRRRRWIPPCSMPAASRAARAWPTARPGRWTTRCPSGSASPTRSSPRPAPTAASAAGFDLNVKDGRIIRVTSNPAAPVNGMELCVKGRYGYDFVHHPERLTKPRVRRYLLDGGAKRPASGAGASGSRSIGTRRWTSSPRSWRR